ncbi:hypothetical protein NQ314_015434 [Rhamnusium bicolor]|uniref:Ataxin-10 n=1 Tax=Rhamnusium bicolor TaxID=1586634 RepID=A0AAV8WZR0_9CUCU|nr:hypothetical protein NQ314_015434 [Rhamnusium bicolor]
MIRELQNDRWGEFSHHLKEAFKIERLDDGIPKKIVVAENVLNCLEEWLDLVFSKYQVLGGQIFEVLVEIIRSLRNCTSNFKTQKYIIENTNILRVMDNIFSNIVGVEPNNICLKVLLQFLINLSSSNKEATKAVFEIFFDKIKMCLSSNICEYESSALIYNFSLSVTITDTELINQIFDIYDSNSTNEFVIFFLERNVSSTHFWSVFTQFKMENKITTLEILKYMQLRKKAHNLPETGLELLTSSFLESVNIIFEMKLTEQNNMKIYELSLILEIISSLSSDENYRQKLQSNKDILINSGVILINIHRLGKVCNNCFTPVQKLSEFKVNSKLKEIATFGFKADLVRLIGNLCWKNRELQNLARTAELIPVILDCCNMDARNPFIMQWAILAVRNLCENNQENQKLIAGLYQEGTVSSEILNEMGLTLHSDGENQLKVVSLDSLKI